MVTTGNRVVAAGRWVVKAGGKKVQAGRLVVATNGCVNTAGVGVVGTDVGCDPVWPLMQCARFGQSQCLVTGL